MTRKLLASFLACFLVFFQTVAPAAALLADGRSDPWTLDKAAHLANRVYYAATAEDIDRLYAAGSAAAAVDTIFPDTTGPDRTAFDAEIAALVASDGFAYNNTGWMRVYYQMRYGRDPYEAKAKLFSLFEDIFALNEYSDQIDYPDVIAHYELVYRHTLGNYRTMVKRVLYNDGNAGDYAMGTFLNLLNGTDPNNPNENYARELMQLFLMGEYLPGDSKEAGSVRNYSEEDVAAFARVITGFRSDSSHQVFFDPSKHNTSTGVAFLTGALVSGYSFPFHDQDTDTLDLGAMSQSVMGNNGLADNAVDYIFAKRQRSIALFLANRLFRFYVDENPTRAELDIVADSLIDHDFEILPSVRELLSSNAMYSDRAMNSVRYKNPLEIVFGTAKLLHSGRPDTVDPLLRRSDALSSIGWNAYNADSIFGREGFDANYKFFTAYVYNQWLTYATRVGNTASAGTYSLDEVFDGLTVDVAGSSFSSGTGFSYTGTLSLGTGAVWFDPQSTAPAAMSTLIESTSTEDGTIESGESGGDETGTGEIQSESDAGVAAQDTTQAQQMEQESSDSSSGSTESETIDDQQDGVDIPGSLNESSEPSEVDTSENDALGTESRSTPLSDGESENSLQPLESPEESAPEVAEDIPTETTDSTPGESTSG